MTFRTTTTNRLLIVFGLLFLLMSGASFSAFKALSDMHKVLNRIVTYNRELRTTLALATAIRDQYAHEAHTIILGNTSHLGYHDEACARVIDLVMKMKAEHAGIDASERIAAIENTSKAQAAWFREQVLPAVLEGDKDRVQAGHNRILEMVGSTQIELDAVATDLASRVHDAEQEADSIAASALQWLFLSHGLALGFALAAALYLRRSIATPLEALGKGAQQLAEGNMDTRIELDTKDEFAVLAAQFNAMTRALERHQARWVRQEKLAAVGRLAAGVAHEINNPLGVMLGYVRLMKEQAGGKFREDLEVVEEEAVRTQHIVEGLLDLARPIDVSDKQVDIGSLCNEVAERVAGALADAASRIDVLGQGRVSGNEQALRQVLTNVIKNAMEASGPGGSVTVRIERGDADDLVIHIDDSGPGLSEESQGRLGEPFFTTKPRGTGLGLAVSRAILESHGGRIDAENRLGGGARFTISLPGSAPGDDDPDSRTRA